jgi:hypothetical protein
VFVKGKVWLHKRSGTVWSVIEIEAGEITLRNNHNGDMQIVGEDELGKSFVAITP